MSYLCHKQGTPTEGKTMTYTIGQQVTVHSTAAARRVANGGGFSATAKVMEIASIVVDGAAYPGQTVYRLRKVGGKGKGGNIQHPADTLEAR